MVISFLFPFCHPTLPRNYRRKGATGSWLAVGPKDADFVVTPKRKTSVSERWNRKGTTKGSAQYAWELTGQHDKVKSLRTSAATQRGQSPSGMSDLTTAACTRETPSPGFRPETPQPPLDSPDPYSCVYPTEQVPQWAGPILEDSDVVATREAAEKKKKDHDMKWLLLPRGGSNSEEEYQRLVLDTMKPRTRSKSRYMSCLLPDRVRKHPKQVAYNNVNESLREDMQSHASKYNCTLGNEMEQKLTLKVSTEMNESETWAASPKSIREETSQVLCQSWKTPTSSYSIKMVTGSQHNKYSRIHSMQSIKDEKADNKTKFNIETLRNWFMSIDVDNKGSLTRREMMNALWQNNHLCGIFGNALGVETNFKKSGSGETGDKDDDTESLFEAEYANTKAEELRAIARILRDIDDDRSGTLKWDELVEFFRRTGNLLEYETEGGHNDMTAFWIDPAYRQTLATGDDDSRLFAIKEQMSIKLKDTKREDAARREQSWMRKPDAQTSKRRSLLAQHTWPGSNSDNLLFSKTLSSTSDDSIENSFNFGMMSSGTRGMGVVEEREEEEPEVDLSNTQRPKLRESEPRWSVNYKALNTGSDAGQGFAGW